MAVMLKTCKRACKWGTPARIYDGPVLHEASAVRLALKRATKGSPERDRLQALLTSQERLCWSCGKRCSDGEAVGLSHAAGNKTA